MTQTQELKNELYKLISDVVEIDDFTDEEDFLNDLGIDSMMMIEIVARIEAQYKISIGEEYLSRMKTFAQVYDVVTELISAKSAFTG